MTDHNTHILDEAAETVYDRPDQHGEPEDSFGRIADLWGAYTDHEYDDYEVSMMLMLVKVAREKEGVYHEDNPRDGAGYWENYARLREGEQEKTLGELQREMDHENNPHNRVVDEK